MKGKALFFALSLSLSIPGSPYIFIFYIFSVLVYCVLYAGVRVYVGVCSVYALRKVITITIIIKELTFFIQIHNGIENVLQPNQQQQKVGKNTESGKSGVKMYTEHRYTLKSEKKN